MEQHSNMRFAWLRTKEGRDAPTATSTGRLIFIAYNVIWWVPIVLPLIGLVSYFAGFVGFLVVTVIRALINAYRVNVMPVERAEGLALRSP